MLAQRKSKELWEIQKFPAGPGLVNGSLNLDLFDDGDVLVSWQAMEDPYHVAILGMLKSQGWV